MSNSASRDARKKKKGATAPTIAKGPLIAAGVGFALLFAGFVAFTESKAPPPPSAIGGPFQLTAQDGRAVDDKEMLGKPHLVFFGYTHCADICHTTLFEMSEILRTMGPKANIGALFVTVDPERDTPEILKDYLSNFDPRIIGLTGARAALEPMLKEYRIYWKKTPVANDDYAVDHTTAVYLMDKNGHFVNAFNVSRKPADAARELEKYL